ncbi:uncharacterized protein LOC111832358 [Capsella rubella]|uniref:uncharacterized protein LOC111832358 n=1 Tax=Capsella rubella TaxID=81985 RepID=UPI000CD5B805|nr:uncharacterized protein LOC111832358 [Capsella rubella]
MFLWKSLHGALPTKQRLLERHLDVVVDCCRCGAAESILHFLFSCPFAQEVWGLVPYKQALSCSQVDSVRSGLLLANSLIYLPPTGLSAGPLAPWICWNLWKARNQRVFNNRCFSANEVMLRALLDAKEWCEAQFTNHFGQRSQENFTIKRAYVGVVQGWVTFREVVVGTE